jgi:alpha-tubulin suppressor-like RCC1 family protein
MGVLALAPRSAYAASPAGTASISAGGNTSCALERGSAYCWGDNSSGQLGDGSTTDSSSPVAVDLSGALAGKTLTQISVGDSDTCALDDTGAAYCWGGNASGELGDGSTTDSSSPVAVDVSGALAGKILTQISVGAFSVCALDSAGTAYCWGYNGYGELGTGSNARVSAVPVAVDTSGALAGKTLAQISAGSVNACALDTAGAAYCWGDNQTGAVGSTAAATLQTTPVAVYTGGVLAGKTLTQVSAGDLYACALDSGGAAYCWGDDDWGQLGDNTMSDSSQETPVAVDTSGALAGKSLTQISAGYIDSCALDGTGAAYCWGYGPLGGLGNNSTNTSSVPVAVDTSGTLAGRTLTQISSGTGNSHICAADMTGAFYCWGDNLSGDLGDDSQAQSNVPVLAGPEPPSGVTAASGDTSATVSWTPPGSLDGGTVTGYTATALPGGQACATTGATSCTITSLSNGTTYIVTVVAHTTAGDSGASQPVSIVPGGTLAFSSGAAGTAAYGVPFSFTVTVTGSPAPKITRTGALPPGVRFAGMTNGTATISGTPEGSAAGIYPLTITAKNKTATATQAFTLTVTRSPAIKKIPATTATVGIVMNLHITATGYPAPALTESGTLPGALAFTDHGNGTASLAGTPSPASGGSYPITVTATSTSGSASTAFILKIDEAPAITSSAYARAAIGSTFSFQVTATGYPAPRITESGALPKGITFKSATGTFSGTPKAGTAGSYPVTITAKNAVDTITQDFTLTVTG